MLLYLQHNAHSTQPLYEDSYFMHTIKSMGYTNEPAEYESLTETQLASMSLAFAQPVFAKDWDLSDKEENEYWDSFTENV